MFKSTKDFDKAVYGLLAKIRDGEKWRAVPAGMEDIDYFDICKFAIDNALIIGTEISPLMNGSFSASGSPRLTRRGLEFIESFEA